MQVPKRHLPLVGLIGLVVIAGAGGGIYYYQFVVSHNAATYVPSHRMVFMNATIVDVSRNGHGFEIMNTAFLNQTDLPKFSSASGANLTGVKYTNYSGESDNSTIDAHLGDTIIFYIFSKSAPVPPQTGGIIGHGFEIDTPSGSQLVSSITLNFGQWTTVTVTFTGAGSYRYLCWIPCSSLHGNMFGNIVVR